MAEGLTSHWSVSYLADGYEVTITFSGEDLALVMAEGKKLLGKMRKKGLVPVRSRPPFPRPHRTQGGR